MMKMKMKTMKKMTTMSECATINNNNYGINNNGKTPIYSTI